MSKIVPLFLAALTVVPFLKFGRRRAEPGRDPEESDAQFVPVADAAALERLFSASMESSVVLFLHDPYCPISARAHDRVQEAGGEVHMINVSRQHELNRAIEERTGVRHESPQAFVLRDGQAVWYASHGGITTDGLVTARDR